LEFKLAMAAMVVITITGYVIRDPMNVASRSEGGDTTFLILTVHTSLTNIDPIGTAPCGRIHDLQTQGICDTWPVQGRFGAGGGHTPGTDSRACASMLTDLISSWPDSARKSVGTVQQVIPRLESDLTVCYRRDLKVNPRGC
jgi:hypothetical protein